MSQPSRQNAARPDAFWETVRDRINATKAADVINNALDANGSAPTDQQFRAAVFVVNKLLPSLQAVAVQIDDQRPKSVLDLEARAMALGIDPKAIFGGIESTSKAITSESNTNTPVEDKTPLEHAPEPPTDS